MRDQVELSATIQRAMKQKKLTPEQLGKMLGVNAVMLWKIICGDVVPSKHLEKQMIEVLEIKPERVKRLAQLRRNRPHASTGRESNEEKAA